MGRDVDLATAGQWLNYHHLLYFWTTAKEGSMTAAARKLRVTQPTVSGQIRELEERCGGPLLDRRGRETRLTSLGEVVFSYADEIFNIGKELVAHLERPEVDRPVRLVVGVVDAMPKLVAYELLRPALQLQESVYLEVVQGSFDRLLASLSVHSVDVVLSDAPISPHFHVRAYNHPLGESEMAIYASKALAETYEGEFPHALDGKPFLIPARQTMLRRSLEYWFDREGISPRLVAEFDDSALLKAFAADGLGAFAAPSLVAEDLRHAYGVVEVGRCEGVRERYYAISVERRIKHPAVDAIARSAGATLDRPRGKQRTAR